MTKNQIINRVNELNKASEAYYNTGQPIMSDAEFDNKLEELRQWEEETGIVLANSPTHNVGAIVLDNIKKVAHESPMLSLAKCHSAEEVKQFAKGHTLVGSVKLDGLTCRLIFKDGELIRAESRGNGTIGNIITDHVKQFLNIPLHINKEGTYIIDGEALIKTDDFAAGTTQDKLVRNVAAAGTNVQYCDKVGTNGAHTAVTSRAGLDTTAKLTPDEVNKAVTLLKKLKAPKIDGKYIAIIHPSVAYDLRSSEAWIEAHKYAGLTELFTGEIGELHGVRFIETTEAKIFNGEGCPVKTEADESKGTPAVYYSVYATLFLGKDAYGMIDPEGGNLEMIIKDKGQVGGPLNQFSTLGYKFSSAAKILYEDRMVRAARTLPRTRQTEEARWRPAQAGLRKRRDRKGELSWKMHLQV